MNIYLYGGPNGNDLRFNANKTIIENNFPPEVGKNYTIDIKNGFLLLAYPNENDQGSFKFKYWVSPYSIPWYERILTLNFETPDGQKVMYYCIAVISVFGLLICLGFVLCIRRCCCDQSNKISSKVEFTNEKIELPI
jgi:hypothetical protein